MTSLREKFPAMPDGRAVLLSAFAQGITPPPRLTVAEWAEEHRYVSPESGSPYPGEWNGDRVPYLREVQEVLSLSHPCTEVSTMKSAQVAFSEAGLNLVGSVIHTAPSPVLVLLPTLSELEKYAKFKIGPTVEVTPVLKERVRPQQSRAADGSTQSILRYPGGFVVLGHASSSAPLQMMSYRVIVLEEVSEYPYDVEGRGDPVELAYARTKAWRETRGAKIYYCSTPGIDGMCRISAKFEVSDQRRYYVPCPCCGAYQELRWENLKWDRETVPYGEHFLCQAADCGGVIEHRHKADMLAHGVWLKCYPGEAENLPPPRVVQPDDMPRWRTRPSDGRQPGFAIWQAYSPFNSWSGIVTEYLDAKKKGPAGLKVFTQQTLGQPWREKGDAPDAEKLFERRLSYPLRRLPPRTHVLTGFCDVQNDRLQWGVYAFGPGLPGMPTGYRIDGGTLAGDPHEDGVWKQLEAVVSRRYADQRGALWPIQAFGVDTGYLSHRVYLWCRRRPGVFACDGRGGDGPAAWLHPAMGTPKKVDVNWRGQKIRGGCLLWPVGTWPLKSAHYAAMRRMLRGPGPDGLPRPGGLYVNDDADIALLRQMTAETLKKTTRAGRPYQYWEQHGANEELDIAVGCRALSYYLGCDTMTDEQWQALAAQQAAAPVDGATLFDLPLNTVSPLNPVDLVPAPLPASAEPIQEPSVPATPLPTALRRSLARTAESATRPAPPPPQSSGEFYL